MNELEHSAGEGAGDAKSVWPRGPLHERLKAFMIAEIGELTTDLEQLRRRISEDPLTLDSDQSVLDLSRQTGWILGVLAAAGGEDILLSRREPAGVALLVDRLRAVLAAEGVRLLPPAEPMSSVKIASGDWQIPWATANALFVACSESGSSVGQWTFLRVGSQYVLRGYSEVGERFAEFAAELTRALPGTGFRSTRTEWLLNFETPPLS